MKLETIAAKLSVAQINQLLKLKKSPKSNPKLKALQKKQAKLKAILIKLEKQISKLSGGKAPAVKAKKLGRPKKGKTFKVVVTATEKVKVTRKRRNTGLTSAIIKVFEASKKPMKAAEVFAGLASVGFKTGKKNPTKLKKQIGTLLGVQKKYFKKVSQGVYELKA